MSGAPPTQIEVSPRAHAVRGLGEGGASGTGVRYQRATVSGMQMRRPFPGPDEAADLEIEELAMCVLDRLVTTRADRDGLMTREQFVGHHVGEAYREARRALQPYGAFSYDTETAKAAHPEYARALAEAWSFLESQGYLVREDGHARKVFVGRRGEERHAMYRGSSAGTDEPDGARREEPPRADRSPAQVVPECLSGEEARPTAFVSYAHGHATWDRHEVEEWRTTVLHFAVLLCRLGIDAEVDQFHEHDPTVDWNRFGVRRAQEQDYVLLAMSAGYKERWAGRNPSNQGAGAVREADELMGQFDEDQELFHRRVKVVLLPGASARDIPAQLSGLQRFSLSALSKEAAEDLYRTLTGQAATPKPELGPLRQLTPRPIGEDQERALAAAGEVGSGDEAADEIAELRVDLARVETGLADVPEEVRERARRGQVQLPELRMARQMEAQQQKVLERLAVLEREVAASAGTADAGAGDALPYTNSRPDPLRRLIQEILEEAGAASLGDDVADEIADRLRGPGVGPLEIDGLFDDLPGRIPDVHVQKRVKAELHRHGVLKRNPEGRGWVVVDLPLVRAEDVIAPAAPHLAQSESECTIGGPPPPKP